MIFPLKFIVFVSIQHSLNTQEKDKIIMNIMNSEQMKDSSKIEK
jgi:hypothetical protein